MALSGLYMILKVALHPRSRIRSNAYKRKLGLVLKSTPLVGLSLRRRSNTVPLLSIFGAVDKRLSRRPFTAESRVRIPPASPTVYLLFTLGYIRLPTCLKVGKYSSVAQSVVQVTVNHKVGGSSPSTGANMRS